MTTLVEYSDSLRTYLGTVLPQHGVTVGDLPEVSVELEPPYALIRPVRATRRDETSSWVEFRCYLYWGITATYEAGIRGMGAAWQLHGVLANWEFTSGLQMDVGVISPDEGYVDYLISWQDIIDHDYSLDPPEDISWDIRSVVLSYRINE